MKSMSSTSVLLIYLVQAIVVVADDAAEQHVHYDDWSRILPGPTWKVFNPNLARSPSALAVYPTTGTLRFENESSGKLDFQGGYVAAGELLHPNVLTQGYHSALGEYDLNHLEYEIWGDTVLLYAPDTHLSGFRMQWTADGRMVGIRLDGGWEALSVFDSESSNDGNGRERESSSSSRSKCLGPEIVLLPLCWVSMWFLLYMIC